MTDRHGNSDADDRTGRKWKPYVFTGGLLAAFILLSLVWGAVERTGHSDLIFFLLMAAASVAPPYSYRKVSRSAPWGYIVALLIFGLLSCAYFTHDEPWLGVGYAVLAVILFARSIRAAKARREVQQEVLARADRAKLPLRGTGADQARK
jgi:hypothetical protein